MPDVREEAGPLIRIPVFLLLILTCTGLSGQAALKWRFSARAGICSSPVIDGNSLCFGSNDSTFYVLDKRDGSLIWKFVTGGAIKSSPLVCKGSVIFNSADGLIYSLDQRNGVVRWTFRTGGEQTYDMWDYYTSSPVCEDGILYIGSGDSSVYALNADTGEPVWRFPTGGMVHATPVTGDGRVYVGSFDGYFYALDGRTGNLVWKFRTVGDAYFPKGEIQRGAALYGHSVIFGSRDYNIYALDTRTGRGLWNRKEQGSWIVATPFVLDDNIYFGTSDSHTFYAMEAGTGTLLWSVPLNMRVYGRATAYQGKIVFGCFNGILYAVDQATGGKEPVFQTMESKEHYFEIYDDRGSFRDDFELYGSDPEAAEQKILGLGAILSTPLIEDGIIYFGDANGYFYALIL